MSIDHLQAILRTALHEVGHATVARAHGFFGIVQVTMHPIFGSNGSFAHAEIADPAVAAAVGVAGVVAVEIHRDANVDAQTILARLRSGAIAISEPDLASCGYVVTHQCIGDALCVLRTRWSAVMREAEEEARVHGWVP